MSVYARARRHAWWMLGALVVAIVFVALVERIIGHSSIAFGVAIIGLIAANRQMLTYDCPTCGKNLFFRGILVVPWPNRVCTKCGTHLAPPER